MGAEEGLHRKCANLMSLTCDSIDMKGGTLEPHSLTEKDFVLCGIGTAMGRSDQEFRKQFFTNVFNGKEEKAMALAVKYYNSAGINLLKPLGTLEPIVIAWLKVIRILSIEIN